MRERGLRGGAPSDVRDPTHRQHIRHIPSAHLHAPASMPAFTRRRTVGVSSHLGVYNHGMKRPRFEAHPRLFCTRNDRRVQSSRAPHHIRRSSALPREIAMPHRATRGELASEAGAELCFFLLSAEQKLAAQVAPIATAKLSISSSSSYLPIVIRDYHPLLATSGLSVPCAVGWLLLFCTWRF